MFFEKFFLFCVKDLFFWFNLRIFYLDIKFRFFNVIFYFEYKYFEIFLGNYVSKIIGEKFNIICK